LSGLASAFTALTYPELFPKALCQSGSFWWNDEWLRRNARSLFSRPAKLWMSVGDQEREFGVAHQPSGMRQEVSQIEATERIAAELQTLGCPVHHHLFAGGHAFAPWKEELPSALKWLLAETTEAS
jgi:enterochelin esterase-like enzyme